MQKHPEKKDASDSGLTVLELLLTSIMFLRMSEMGSLFTIQLVHHLHFPYCGHTCPPLMYFNFFLDLTTGYGFPYFLFHRWVLLEVLDKVSSGSVNWKQATKPPIKMPFRKVENCNQVIKIGKDLNFSLVNVAGNDIVQGNKKLLLGSF